MGRNLRRLPRGGDCCAGDSDLPSHQRLTGALQDGEPPRKCHSRNVEQAVRSRLSRPLGEGAQNQRPMTLFELGAFFLTKEKAAQA